MSADALTEKIHARADRKLVEFLESRFGDLFQLCGGHGGTERPKLEDFPQMKKTLTNCEMPQKFPWKGSVIELARLVCFAHLRNQWREKEMRDFMEKVEAVSQIVEEAQP